MNENGKARRDDDATTTRGCARAEELVTYLYGESTPAEASLFRQHLGACAVCREEFASFGGVREGLGAWRAEALGAVPSLDIKGALGAATNIKEEPASAGALRRPPERKRSAAAALREFFTLSPLWLRAGVAAALPAVCALAALTLARAEVRWDSDGLAFRAGVVERTVVERVSEPADEPVRSGYTEEQLNAVVAERLKEARAQWEAARPRPEVVDVSGVEPKRSALRAAVKPGAGRVRRSTPRASGSDDELADLPRLSDLLEGSY